jgi:hypothetical protein
MHLRVLHSQDFYFCSLLDFIDEYAYEEMFWCGVDNGANGALLPKC